MDSLIIDFSELSITNNNNNFNDEINEFMNIGIDYPEKYKYPYAIIYGFKKIRDVENNFFYIVNSLFLSLQGNFSIIYFSIFFHPPILSIYLYNFVFSFFDNVKCF